MDAARLVVLRRLPALFLPLLVCTWPIYSRPPPRAAGREWEPSCSRNQMAPDPAAEAPAEARLPKPERTHGHLPTGRLNEHLCCTCTSAAPAPLLHLCCTSAAPREFEITPNRSVATRARGAGHLRGAAAYAARWGGVGRTTEIGFLHRPSLQRAPSNPPALGLGAVGGRREWSLPRDLGN